MKRYTKRDEYGNADIKGLEDELQDFALSLPFDKMNYLTCALNRFAELEETVNTTNMGNSPVDRYTYFDDYMQVTIVGLEDELEWFMGNLPAEKSKLFYNTLYKFARLEEHEVLSRAGRI